MKRIAIVVFHWVFYFTLFGYAMRSAGKREYTDGLIAASATFYATATTAFDWLYNKARKAREDKR